MEEQLNYGKISHEKQPVSPPPAILGKRLMPVPAGRAAVSQHKSLVGQENKHLCHMDTLVQPMFCSQNPGVKSEQKFTASA